MWVSLADRGIDWRPHYERFERERVLHRLRALDACVNARGLAARDPAGESLVRIGMELDAAGRVVRNGYGVFNLAWQAASHPEWADVMAAEADEIRGRIRAAHGARLRFVIWAGMGGSIEDKSMYNALGVLRGRVRFYALDSTDPAKLEAILADMRRRDGRPLRDVLRSTLVVAMALGMTSFEPVVNLKALARLYERQRLDARANFLYLTLPGSLLDAFAGPRGFTRVPLQLDDRYTTSGRHSGPLTRGSLLPLALAGVDLRQWIAATNLSDGAVMRAWTLAAFVHAAGLAGRDKVTLLLPRALQGAGLWTKQDFEESLGKSEDLGVKIMIGEQRPDTGRDDQVILRVRVAGAGERPEQPARPPLPAATLTLPAGSPLSRYMQFIHYVVFGVGYLRDMNFVTQPSVELYKSIASELHEEARKAGGPTSTDAWRTMSRTPRQATWRRRLTIYFDGVDVGRVLWTRRAETSQGDAAEQYASLLLDLARTGAVEYGELTFFGDTRYSEPGRAAARFLARAGERIFRRRLRMPVDVYEGPAVNHSYHEMIIGHGRCVSTIVLPARQRAIRALDYDADYHVSQFLATKLALTRRRRPVIAIVLKDLSAATLSAANEFADAAAAAVRRQERRR